MSEQLRIFVSSPVDVIPERRRARLLIEKLAKEYVRFFSIESVLWEVEPMLASGHFQDQIIPPSETDIVILVLWSRLGTALPEKTETREYRGIDGRVPVTGTEWEFEDALASQRKRGAPQILAYRKDADPTVSLRDSGRKIEAEKQWKKLNDFCDRWFGTKDQFGVAFSMFEDLDGFETKFENDLRSLIEKQIIATHGKGEPQGQMTWLGGSPFRGLESYRFEHASIFFGRTEVTKIAVERLTENAEQGRSFLLVLGASGSGKSSLVQAGVLPALTGRGIVAGTGLWRRAVTRPNAVPGGPFISLAEALAADTALPNLLGRERTVQSLARHLRVSADDASFPLLAALHDIEDEARQKNELLKVESARLVLVVDQFEELFTNPESSTEDRRAYVRCINGLAGCGVSSLLLPCAATTGTERLKPQS